ncbi:integrase [Croceicoccus mobilis]|uniref:Integrase n=2 Tax=Croceicoccus mobilis TaxID=1703339 RepID=A0A916YS24_9SPHN|nr:integrase [Croceicoccus mobilis]
MGLYIMHILKHSSGRRSFRRVIPDDLRPFCGGKREHKVSLGFESDPEFLTRYATASAECDQLLAQARRRQAGAHDPLDHLLIARLAEIYYRQAMEDDDEARFSPEERSLFANVRDRAQEHDAGALNWRGDPRRRWADKNRETTEGMLSVYRDRRAIGDVDGIVELWEDEAQLLAEVDDAFLDPNDHKGMQRLCLALNDAAIKACQDKLRRLDGDEILTPSEPERQPGPARQKSQPNEGVSLLDIYDRYALAKGLTPGVRDEWRRYIKRLVEFVGHDDATRISSDDLRAWRDVLLQEPTKRGARRDPSTVRDKYITSVRAALGWAVQERALSTNVAADVVVDVPKKARLRDPDFTAAEAEAILKASLMSPAAKMSDCYVRARRWIPWLCAYTGARVNEFSQLRREDVKQIGDIWTVRITPEAGRVKTNEARIVPIHEHLIEQGFVAMVLSQPEGPLFYEPGRQRVDVESNRHFKKVGERLAKWVRDEVGITDKGIKPNHAWRHTFKSLSYTAGIEERVADAIQGHAPATTGRRYGKPPLVALAEAIGKIPRFNVDTPIVVTSTSSERSGSCEAPANAV